MNFSSVNFGIIGLGCRGTDLSRTLSQMDDVNIVAVCDVYQDRIDRVCSDLEAAGKCRPATTLNYHDILTMESVDAVLITTAWQTHLTIAIEAMKAGKWVASEVCGACSVDQCWELVRTHQETKVPCMMLENCNYGREEMALLNMVQQNVFGELIHLRCGYGHDLRDEVSMGHINRHYRLDNYMNRNGELYPTHGAGPMSKLLNINRGNRFVSLVSVATKARGLNEYVKSKINDVPALAELNGYNFTQADVVTTIITCAHGETLMLTHDTTLPRPYSRFGYVQGTKGLWMEENRGIYLEDRSENRHAWDSFEPYLKEYEHPLWKWYLEEGIKGSHGGMDYLTLRAFVESFQNNTETPLNVYDFATMTAITALSEQSVATGSMPQPFPDFTNGRWLVPEPARSWKYGLDVIPTL